MGDLTEASRRARRGGSERHRDMAARQAGLSVRQRLLRLLDEDSLAEDGLLAQSERDGMSFGGVVTGIGTIAARPVAVMAEDPTVEAGSSGAERAEKIVRIQEQALAQRVPMVYLVDSAGPNSSEALRMFPGRRGTGRIFHTAVKLSGAVPQVCVLFGPSAAGGGYVPAFCDVVIAREDATLQTGVSSRAHLLVHSDAEGIDAAKRYLSFVPSHWEWAAPVARPAEPASERPIRDLVPKDQDQPFDIRELLDSLLDASSFFELHARGARELVVGYARLNGRAVGVVANQPAVEAGAKLPDSADKAARFIHACNAFNLALLFLVDVPRVQGSPGDAAKMISAVSEATVPKISVIVRKAHGAGLCAMAGPGLEPDACLALPGASIAGVGPQSEHGEDADAVRLARELVVDAVVEPQDLRAELIRRFAVYAGKRRERPVKRNAIAPV